MTVPAKSRAVAWIKDEPLGMEFAQIALSPRSLTAHGVAIGSEPVPYRLDYELETGEDFVTTRLEVTLTLDEDGVVVEYPGIARRVPPR